MGRAGKPGVLATAVWPGPSPPTLSPSSHLCAQGLSGKLPSEHRPGGGRGSRGPSQWAAGLSGWGLRTGVSCPRGKPGSPMFALVSSECCGPRRRWGPPCPGGSRPGLLPPPRSAAQGLGVGPAAPGSLAEDSNKLISRVQHEDRCPAAFSGTGWGGVGSPRADPRGSEPALGKRPCLHLCLSSESPGSEGAGLGAGALPQYQGPWAGGAGPPGLEQDPRVWMQPGRDAGPRKLVPVPGCLAGWAVSRARVRLSPAWALRQERRQGQGQQWA